MFENKFMLCNAFIKYPLILKTEEMKVYASLFVANSQRQGDCDICFYLCFMWSEYVLKMLFWVNLKSLH